jgi:hypothetical protein
VQRALRIVQCGRWWWWWWWCSGVVVSSSIAFLLQLARSPPQGHVPRSRHLCTLSLPGSHTL